ncbi:hypothetical protein CEXT_91201 [Caerostris extrusa]|uniref:Uncharacterized protein n=1 Tax=Caerostris extrusa TaxID=172846 RepID=A0AAV4SF98_CAEEX|nr:hypothetical protein CEXT_91201 [Caerostris extrusa]
MERDATMDYTVRESAPGASNPELMDATCISTVIKKKGIAQNLYDAYAAALTGYSPDDDDLKEMKIRLDDLQLAMRERNAAHLNNHEHDNDGFYYAPKKLIAKVNCAKNPQHLVETKNSFDKLSVDEQEEQDSIVNYRSYEMGFRTKSKNILSYEHIRVCKTSLLKPAPPPLAFGGEWGAAMPDESQLVAALPCA